MSTPNKTNKNPEIALYQHPLWSAVLWVVGYFVATCVGLILFYIFREDIGGLFGTKDSLWTIENCIKVVIGIFALFAFVVTIWRGNLHAQQVFSQIEQLKLGRDQLEKTEDNNIAKLLVDGTKLLNIDTTKAEKLAGIACLATIIMGESKFQHQATTVINTFVEGVVSDYISGGTQLIITDAKVRRKYFPIKSKNCEVYNSLNALSQYTSKDNSEGAFFFKNIRIEGLRLKGQDFPTWIFDLLYFKCAFENAYIGINAEYIGSTFYQCEIGSLGSSAFVCIFRYCIFNSCNTWTKIPSEWGERFKNCVYNDKYVTDDQSRKFFESIGIPPLSSLTAEKRREFGPQKTT